MRASDKSRIDICYSPHLTHYNSHTSFDESTRVLVRPIGLDMVEVGGSNPPGPTNFYVSVFIRFYFFKIARLCVFLCVDTTAER